MRRGACVAVARAPGLVDSPLGRGRLSVRWCTEVSLPPAPDMTAPDIVQRLDEHIIGQADAKRAVAVALRNRWRRERVRPDLRDDVLPKNILLIGPTGIGKTEIARRVAKLVDCPFVKVEATKYTEVGYHGRDVEGIISDLFRASLRFVKSKIKEQEGPRLEEEAKQEVMKQLTGGAAMNLHWDDLVKNGARVPMPRQNPGNNIILSALHMGRQPTTEEQVPILTGLTEVFERKLAQLLESEAVTQMAVKACEESGIVVIDEIDKIVCESVRGFRHNASAEGVQQDLLPLVEGTVVQLTKPHEDIYINTDGILFLASGAFHSVKPTEMIAELQGRFPIRAELKPLTKNDFYRILTEPANNIIQQHTAMLETEGVALTFTEDALREVANVAFSANASTQNTGARRLTTVVEKVLEDIHYEATPGEYRVSAETVQTQIGDMFTVTDLAKLII